MFAERKNSSSPGLRASLGRFLHSLLPHRLFQLAGVVWSYLMGPWDVSSLLPSEWSVHRAVRTGEVLEVLSLQPGSWDELGECLDELGPWTKLISSDGGVDVELVKSWQGLCRDEESAFKGLTSWQKAMIHRNMQVFWQQGLPSWNNDAVGEECHKTAAANHETEPNRSDEKLHASSLGLISYDLNVGTGGILTRVQWPDDHKIFAVEDNRGQNEFEIQHIRNKRLQFLQQTKIPEGLASDIKQEHGEIEQTTVTEIPDPTGFLSLSQPVSNGNLNLCVSQCLESQSRIIYEQCDLISDVSLLQGDVLEIPEIKNCSSCDQLPVVGHEVDKSGNHQHICSSVPDKDQGYHSLEYWQCHPHPQNLSAENMETSETCELDRESVFSLPVDDQNSKDVDFNLQDEIPIPSITFCTNKHIGYILGTVVSDDDDDSSPSSSDDWDKKEDDDGFDSIGSISITDSETDVPQDVLWHSICSPDPYNPQNFTASLQTGVIPRKNSPSQETLDQDQSDEESWCDSDAESDSDSNCSANEEENLKLWNAFSKSDDPYNPLSFKALVQTSDKKRQSCEIASTYSEPVCRLFSNQKVTLFTGQAYDIQQLQFKETHEVPVENSANLGHKKVTFHENVTIHYVCNEEERKGHWEELARDRCRFQRRIKETEYIIGYCLTPSHRKGAWERIQGQWGS